MKTVTLTKNRQAKQSTKQEVNQTIFPLKQLDSEIKVLYKKYKLIRKKFYSFLDVNPKEAKCLMSSHYIELIDDIPIRIREYTDEDNIRFNEHPHLYNAKIYGILSDNKTYGLNRYSDVYIHFRYYIIKCLDLESAYNLIPLLKEQSKINDKIIELEHKYFELYNRQKKQLSANAKTKAA